MTLTPFDEMLTAERTPIFTLSSITPLSPLRNVVTGTPTDTDEEYVLSSGDKVETADIGNYTPGFAAEAGIGVRVGTMPTDGVMRWGYYDDEDGFFFEYDGTDGLLYAVVRRDSVDTRTVESAWNGDRRDGATNTEPTGRSALEIDLTQGLIFQIRFTWYGYGQVQWQAVDTRASRDQDVVTLHRFATTGETSIRNPNLPITAENTSTDGVMYLAGRQFSILGRTKPQQRTHATTRTLASVTTTWTPIIAFRRRDVDDAKRVRLQVQGMSAFVSGNMQIALVLNPTVTFGTAVNADLSTAAESIAEFSINPSAYTVGSGSVMLTDIVNATGTGSNTAGADKWPGLSLPVPRRQPVVMVARALSGTADITALLRATEEW